YVNPREFTQDVHRTVDDTPYGGGAGMVMKAPPMVAAIEKAKSRSANSKVIMLTPQGAPLSQAQLAEWSELEHLVLVCGRYEGFDERIRDFVDCEVSVGDFVLTGGEYGALTLLDGVIRLLPGTLGNAASHAGDSFSHGLLEHPQFTRPSSFRDRVVPEVLTSGDHTKIANWRQKASLARTLRRRPEILAWARLSDQERSVLRTLEHERPRLCVAMTVHESESAASMFDHLHQLILAFNLEMAFVLPKPSNEPGNKLSQQYNAWLKKLQAKDFVSPERQGSRKQWKIDKDRAHQEFAALQSAGQNIKICAQADEISQYFADSKFRLIAYDPHQRPETNPVDRLSFRGTSAECAQVFCFDIDLEKFDAWLSPVRIRGKNTRVSSGVACALVLDRLILEA
ncbi:MAG: tRNA (guanosine(37)-N1)-methyltransferase TrmD, partial [Myxococcota bacterium]|nr:tRNA (guanosine(37)-N1)-methyltransferase TrmD [Myxococcota bacterium]